MTPHRVVWTVTSSFANGISSVFNYDDDGRLTHLERAKNNTPPTMLVEYDYGYDAVGNRLYTRDMVATDRSELYGHDARNRLRNFERGTLDSGGTTINPNLPDSVLPSQQQWTLDARGNWVDFSTTLNGNTTQQTRKRNEVNEIQTLDPDGSGGQPAVALLNNNNGNLTENPWAFNAGDSGTPTGQKYEYDEENRLVRVRRLTSPADQILLEIGYDTFGRRVESKEYLDANGQPLSPPRVTHHVVFGAMTVEEYTVTAGPTVALIRELVWGNEFPMPVAMIDRTGSQAQVLHYLRDVLGNVVALTNASGDVVERYRYDPYGTTHIYNASGTPLPTSAYGNPFAFTGQRYDAAVDLYHFWFRTYSPSLGRWHQRDPVGYVDGVSLYQYAVGSPLNGTDPLGLQCMDDMPGLPLYSKEDMQPPPPGPFGGTWKGDSIHAALWGHFYDNDQLANMTDGQARFTVVGGATVSVLTGWYGGPALYAAGAAFLARGSMSLGTSDPEFLRWGPSRGFFGPDGTWARVWRIAIGGPEGGWSFHIHIWSRNWYKPWTWGEQF
jgi:RHS repeat-associated protein